MQILVLSVGLLLLGGSGAQDAPSEDELLRRTILLEYPKALRELEAFYTTAAGEVLATERRPLSKKSPVTTTIYRFASCAPDMAMVAKRSSATSFDPGDDAETVVCCNKSYSFSLSKSPGKSEFAIRLLTKDREAIGARLQNRLDPYLKAPFELLLLPVRTIMEQPGFSIRSAAWRERDGKRLLSIDFDCPMEKNRQGGYEGTLLVAPAQKWALIEYELRFKKGDGLRVGAIEYEGAVDGFPVPKRVSHSGLKTADRTPIKVATFELKGVRFERLPEKEFTLSAFGLPEIDVVNRRRRGGAEYWLVGASLVALAIAGMFWIASARARRRQAA